MKIGIANDHASVEMKQQVVAYLKEKGYDVVNYGTDSTESCDYPVYGEKIGHAVASGEVDFGIAICGTGLGISLRQTRSTESGLPSAANRTPPDCQDSITTQIFLRLVPV